MAFSGHLYIAAQNVAWHSLRIAVKTLEIARLIAVDRNQRINELGSTFVGSQAPGSHSKLWKALKEVTTQSPRI